MRPNQSNVLTTWNGRNATEAHEIPRYFREAAVSNARRGELNSRRQNRETEYPPDGLARV